jgi:type I restriction enzyme, S subunit
MSDWQQITLGRLFSADNSKLGPNAVEPTVMSLYKYAGFVRADEYFDKRIASEKLDGYKPVEPGGWAYSTIHVDEGSIARNNLGETGVISPMYTTLKWRGEGAALP